ncbi:MAG: SpoIID/LytB domain-containing protein [Vicinamibacterales bacterium]
MTLLSSRRGVLAALGALAFRALGGRADAQDEVTDIDLERGSVGRSIRIGTPATGAVAIMPLEVYVARVLAAESDPRALDAAREALAVAIRTYALVNEGRHSRDGYDLCDNVHCQVVRGSNPLTRRLTQNTAMQVLTFEGRPAQLYYSASCGGRSERAIDVWPGVNYPYLQSRVDAVHEDEQPWTFDLPLAEANAVLIRAGFEGELAGVTVGGWTSSGRVATLRLAGLEPGVIDGNQFRLAVGSTRLRSTAFGMITEGDTLRFAGRGYGHGVGMCVIGAGKRAMRGESAREILTQYYPGLELVRLRA